MSTVCNWFFTSDLTYLFPCVRRCISHRLFKMNFPSSLRIEFLICGITFPQTLNQTGCGWNLSVEMFLSLFLLYLQGEARAKNTLRGYILIRYMLHMMNSFEMQICSGDTLLCCFKNLGRLLIVCKKKGKEKKTQILFFLVILLQ